MSEEAEQKPEGLVRRVIPKFTSFKPVATLVPTAHPEEPQRKSDEGRHHEHKRRHRTRSRSPGRRHRREDREREHERSGKERRSRREEDRDRSHRHHRRRSKTPKSSGAHRIASDTLRSSSPESWDAPKKEFFLDTKGDQNNIVYGTIHRYEIPIYHRHGAGRVVGLPTHAKIDREKGDGKGLVISTRGADQGDASNKRGWNSFAKLEAKDVRLLKVKANPDETGLEEAFSRQLDFVSFSTKTKKRKRDGDVSGSDDEEDNLDHYRPIEGPRERPEKPEDKDLEFATESESGEDYISNNHWDDRKRTVELARKVETEPTNVDAWLEYVDHQDRTQQTSGRRRTAAEKMSTAEIKLDILSKALQRCPGNEALLVKYMDVAADIWDSEKLKAKWEKILGENTTVTGLWKRYIDFRQTDFLSFTYPECFKCFAQCIAVLRTTVFNKGVHDRDKLEEIIVYVFCRSALLMREAGYEELAVASFQAMLELNLFRPPHISSPTTSLEHEAILEEFEKFWESEVLRIGETNARGWSQSTVNGEDGCIPIPVQENLDLPELDLDDPFGSWTDAEIEFSGKVRMPARTIDEVEEDDPYRVVLFSDIKPLMYAVSSWHAKNKLIEAMLQFYHLPPLASISSNDATSADPFLRNDFLHATELVSLDDWFWPRKHYQHKKLITWEGMEPARRSSIEENPFVFKMHNFPRGVELMFNRSSLWFCGGEGMKIADTHDREFIGNLLQSLAGLTGLYIRGDELALYYLAWMCENRPESAKKTAKTLLKRVKTSLRLWSAYAQIEWYGGNRDTARNVFSTALAMSEGFPVNSALDSIVLWNAWLWAELECGNTDEAVRILLSIEGLKLLGPDELGDNLVIAGKIPKAMLLKANNYLERRQSEMLSMRYFEHAGLYNQARALLAYVVRLDVSATTIFDDFIIELDRRDAAGSTSVENEICLLRKMRLFYHHSRTAKIFKMSLLRNALESAIKVFRHNTAFLALYTWNESRTKVENRVRTLLRDHVLIEENETVVDWVFAIWAELNMRHTWNVHAVRNLFQRATECKNIRNNIQLWLLFMEFEMRLDEPGKAKETMFRAMQSCPWSKAIILNAFIKLRSILELEDMSKLLSIMSSEKELRVHDVTELEDMIEDLNKSSVRRRQALGHAKDSDIFHLPDDRDTDEEMDDA